MRIQDKDVQDEVDWENQKNLVCKEDSRKTIRGASTEKIIQPKIIVNRKNPIVDIGEPIYESIEPDKSFNSNFFGKDESKDWNSIERNKNSNSTINSNLELTKINSSLEYPMKDSTPKLVGVDFEILKVEFSRANFSSEFTHQDSIPEYVGAIFKIGVIMISCVFIQINEPTLEG